MLFRSTHTPLSTKVKPKEIKTKKVKNTSLQEIAYKVHVCINTFFTLNTSILQDITKVMIELQPRINNKMKFVSHVIFSKMVEYFSNVSQTPKIVFERATKKLQIYKGPYIECTLKNQYSRRKFLGIEHTKRLLYNIHEHKEWRERFEHHSKKDDLADCFLMCYGAIMR